MGAWRNVQKDGAIEIYGSLFYHNMEGHTFPVGHRVWVEDGFEDNEIQVFSERYDGFMGIAVCPRVFDKTWARAERKAETRMRQIRERMKQAMHEVKDAVEAIDTALDSVPLVTTDPASVNQAIAGVEKVLKEVEALPEPTQTIFSCLLCPEGQRQRYDDVLPLVDHTVHAHGLDRAGVIAATPVKLEGVRTADGSQRVTRFRIDNGTEIAEQHENTGVFILPPLKEIGRVVVIATFLAMNGDVDGSTPLSTEMYTFAYPVHEGLTHQQIADSLIGDITASWESPAIDHVPPERMKAFGELGKEWSWRDANVEQAEESTSDTPDRAVASGVAADTE